MCDPYRPISKEHLFVKPYENIFTNGSAYQITDTTECLHASIVVSLAGSVCEHCGKDMSHIVKMGN